MPHKNGGDELIEVGVYRRPEWLGGCDDIERLRKLVASRVGSGSIVRIRGDFVEVQVPSGLLSRVDDVLGRRIETLRASKSWSWRLYLRSLRVGAYWFAHTVGEVLWRDVGDEMGRWLAVYAGAFALAQECRRDASMRVLSKLPDGIADVECASRLIEDVLSGKVVDVGECLLVENVGGG